MRAPPDSSRVRDWSWPVWSGSVNSGARSPTCNILTTPSLRPGFLLRPILSYWRRVTPPHDRGMIYINDRLRIRNTLVWNALLLVFVALSGGVAQLGERRVRNAKVEGSIPFSSTSPKDRSIDSGLYPKSLGSSVDRANAS